MNNTFQILALIHDEQDSEIITDYPLESITTIQTGKKCPLCMITLPNFERPQSVEDKPPSLNNKNE